MPSLYSSWCLPLGLLQQVNVVPVLSIPELDA